MNDSRKAERRRQINVATMCYLKYQGRTLFLLKNESEEDINSRLYVPPGGKFENGERGLDCVLAEFKEETGLEVKNPRLRAIIRFDNRDRIMGNGMPTDKDHVVMTYEATEFTGELRGGKEGTPCWIEDSMIPSLRMHDGDLRILDLINNNDGVYEILVRAQGEKITEFKATRVY